MDYKTFITAATLLFTIVQAAVSVGYVRRKKYMFAVENILLYLLYVFFLYAQYKWKFQIERLLISFVVLTVWGHTLLGEYFDLYRKKKFFDRLLHGFGTFSFALFAYSLLYKTLQPVVSPSLYAALFIVNLGIALGALFEILEFGIDVFFKVKSQSGLRDTDVDLIADVIGSLLAGLTYTYFI